MKKEFISIFSAYAFILFGCANQSMPNGGPKDTAPPVLQKSIPENGQTNFKGKLIELTFDELIKLNNPNEEIIISPTPGKGVRFAAKTNKVTIETKEDWKDSTTYNFTFRESIQDLNEGNPVKNIKLAFSTGPWLDTLTISGNITQPLTEAIPDKITVALYEQDTFDIFKHTPDIFTKCLKDGSFKLPNLKAGNYRIYAFDDKNKNLKVESQTERFALFPEILHLKGNIDSLHLSIYLVDSRPLKITSVRSSGKVTTVKFNKAIVEYKLNLDNPSKSTLNYCYGDNQTEINIYNPPPDADSVKLSLAAHDSLNFKIDSTFYVKGSKTKVTNERFNVLFDDGHLDLETGTFEMQAQFNKPLFKINFDSTYIRIDTLDSIFFSPEDIKIDTVKKKLSIRKKLDKKLFTKPKLPAPPDIRLAMGFLVSIQSDSSRFDVKPIRFTREEETGTLRVTVQTQHKYYIVQLLASNNTIIGTFTNRKDYAFKKLPAQDYKMRVILDENGNGRWDAQNVFTNEPPEQTLYYKAQNKKYTFPIRAGWELGPLLFKF